MADLLFELIFEAVFTGALEGSVSYRISKPLRLFFRVLFILLFAAIVGVPAVIGIISLKDNVPFAVMMLLLAAFFAIAIPLEARSEYRKRRKAMTNGSADEG